MRYELADYEWSPNKPHGVPRVNDRRVLNGIFWVLRSGAPWRDLPEAFGPHTTCYNRFVRWRRAGVRIRSIDALAATHDAAVQMIDTSIVRVHRMERASPGTEIHGLWESSPALTGRVVIPFPRHILADGRRGDRKSELEQFTVNAWRTPKPVFLAHAPDQRP
jgi:transposase